MSETDLACCHHFAAEYEQNAHPAFRALERTVLGCDYGGTSWTTREQADAIASSLDLHGGMRMLEVGSGTGWPAVYLASQRSCELILSDLPLNALKQARSRAAEEALESTVQAVSASGAQLPFASASFDALGHSDVLCCLPEKLAMLEECRRVARPRARMLFYVIAPTPDLIGADRVEAIEAGPPFVETSVEYSVWLAQSGWRELQRESVSQEYLQSLRSLVAGLEADAKTFDEILEDGEFPATLERRRRQIRAIEQGLLVREMYLAEAV